MGRLEEALVVVAPRQMIIIMVDYDKQIMSISTTLAHANEHGSVILMMGFIFGLREWCFKA